MPQFSTLPKVVNSEYGKYICEAVGPSVGNTLKADIFHVNCRIYIVEHSIHGFT